MKKIIALALALCLTLCMAPTALAGASSLSPIAENLEITTYRGVSVGVRLKARTSDRSPVSFEITTRPVKGSLDLEEDGHFVYTPESGKRGKDYFGYCAVDEAGNRSQEATVIIRIEKQQSKVTYADLTGSEAEYAACRLAEAGLFIGENIAGEYVFSPDTPVTREEFLVLCMKLSGTEPLKDAKSTGFSDDEVIAPWVKPYVSSALRSGIISGYVAESGAAVFEPDRSISVLEASVMLNRSMELTDAVQTWFSADAVPAWAAQSAANVSSCDLLPYGCSFSDPVLTRAEAAVLLSGAADLPSRR